jgi:CTP:phosphocholine cytidylyltransferase-like protein
MPETLSQFEPSVDNNEFSKSSELYSLYLAKDKIKNNAIIKQFLFNNCR